jgi:hypothetical protein
MSVEIVREDLRAFVVRSGMGARQDNLLALIAQTDFLRYNREHRAPVQRAKDAVTHALHLRWAGIDVGAAECGVGGDFVRGLVEGG